ncbi:MAG: transcriptional regulator [Microbacteriaceae bacterium]|jgi:nitrogen regulatory protein P-II 2|nr:transcriptional regulator [Microbacteriaceae bacterium]MBT5616833.1 transcriptional regulator [Microbacteriaceae bacterium]
MELVQRKLVTIVAESALEKRLVHDVHEAGIKGYTVSLVHGAGVRGQREGDLQGGNIKIECVVAKELVETIFALLEINYFPHYACVAWASDVDVARGENY